MVIIWRGLGFLVLVIAFGFSLLANLIFDSVVGEGYYDHHLWPCAISLIFSAAVCWLLGDYLRKRSGQVVIDKATGKEYPVGRSQHALFFIPMHYWGPILLVGALVALGIEFLSRAR